MERGSETLGKIDKDEPVNEQQLLWIPVTQSQWMTVAENAVRSGSLRASFYSPVAVLIGWGSQSTPQQTSVRKHKILNLRLWKKEIMNPNNWVTYGISSRVWCQRNTLSHTHMHKPRPNSQTTPTRTNQARAFALSWPLTYRINSNIT